MEGPYWVLVSTGSGLSVSSMLVAVRGTKTATSSTGEKKHVLCSILAKPFQHSPLQIHMCQTLHIFDLYIVAFLLQCNHSLFSHFENHEKCRLQDAMSPCNLSLCNPLLIHFLDDLEFSIVTFSPCGKYLAGCTIGGDICVWDIKQESCVMHEIIKNKNQVCALAWNPSGSGELGYCDFTGQLGTIEGCIPVELDSNLDGSLKVHISLQ
ncbi:unnamed protein product, partial [Timema podura]|nr:unnamed protein product [Timema podura]